jgi:hypothetical protein
VGLKKKKELIKKFDTGKKCKNNALFWSTVSAPLKKVQKSILSYG